MVHTGVGAPDPNAKRNVERSAVVKGGGYPARTCTFFQIEYTEYKWVTSAEIKVAYKERHQASHSVAKV